MLRKTIIAGAAAALLGAGALAATTTSASASYYGNGYVGGNGWYFGWGNAPRHKYQQPRRHHYKPARRQVCKPKYKTVRYWKPHYGWVSYRQYAGRVCYWQPTYRR